jgi:hypothetical protein
VHIFILIVTFEFGKENKVPINKREMATKTVIKTRAASKTAATATTATTTTNDYSEEILNSLQDRPVDDDTVDNHMTGKANDNNTPKSQANFVSRRLVNKPFKDENESKWWFGKSVAQTEFMNSLSILFPGKIR